MYMPTSTPITLPMSPNPVMVVCDTMNLFLSAERNLKFHDRSLIAPVVADMVRSLGGIDAYAFLDAGQERPEVRQSIVNSGFTIMDCPDHEQGLYRKSSVDPAIIFFLAKLACQRKPATLVLGSGDRDFLLPATELRNSGWRVVLLGVKDCISRDLLRVCDDFLPLTLSSFPLSRPEPSTPAPTPPEQDPQQGPSASSHSF